MKRKPIIAVVGRPNVGKSTFVNRLVGRRQSIVDDMPGVTRDRIYFDVEWQNKQFTVIDTGGIIPGDEDDIMLSIYDQAKIACEEADKIIFIVDGMEGATPVDIDIANILRQSDKPIFLAVNKVDSHNQITMISDFYSLAVGDPIAISALHGSGGVGDLLEEITADFTEDEKFEEDIKISNFGKECRAFVKIQDGCDNFCSYCIIPRTRGNSRSRSHEEIIEEVKRLYKSDYRELVITGIDMGSYEDPNDDEYKLDDLIEDIIINTPDGYRIRISSLETSQMTQKLLDLFINHSDKLVSHVHIPLQSGSSEIVKAMHRKYDLEEFVEKVNYLRKHLPYLALSTDVIVGFPGETEDLFMETYKFIEKLKFMRLHVFPYSPRPGTLAASLKDQIPGNIKKERVHRLIDLGNKLQEEYIKFCNGQTFVFLAEKVIKKDGKLIYQGYLDNYLEISVECEKDILSKLVKVKVDNGKFLIV